MQSKNNNILGLDDFIPFGKWEGNTINQMLSTSFDANWKGVKYLCWLFTKTGLRCNDEVRVAINKKIRYLNTLKEESRAEFDRKYWYTDEDINTGYAELGRDY